MSTTLRLSFPEDLEPLRNNLARLLPSLEREPGWYGSVYFQSKSQKTLSANLKQTNLAEKLVTGVVFRIYDGCTLFEQATDDLQPESLQAAVDRLVRRVKSSGPVKGVQARPYRPATWSERLGEGQSGPLDEEIRSQIPAGVTATTPVHFGIRYAQDPRTAPVEHQFQELRRIVERCVELAPPSGLKIEELSFVAVRQNIEVEDALFIDREVNLSQSLARVNRLLITMSGGERTFSRTGGLGGMEILRTSDSDITHLLRDLVGINHAEKLAPGRYRVIFGPVLTGVLAHEAFGHSQEGDTCARGRSKAWDLYHSGVPVGNQHATILNNPAIFQDGMEKHGAWGSYFFDEEGWLAREQVILDRGKLRAPMANLTSAIRLGVPRTANGKRESWANGVYTRQTNTYFSAGDKTLAELMELLGDGFLADEAMGGMEDPKGMGIQVGVSFLREVKGGKLTGRYFRGPSGGPLQMTGYVPDVLNSIIAKSKVEFDSSAPDKAKHPYNDVGGCGKYHKELVNAGCGGTYLLLDNIILG